MPENISKHQTIYQYLLGTMSVPEQEQFEVEYFSQPELSQEIWAVFDEITERLLARELPAQDAQKFAVQLQTKPYLRARAEKILPLYQGFARVAEKESVKTQRQANSLKFSFSQWLPLPVWQWGAGIVGILLLAVGGYVFWDKTAQPLAEIASAQPTVSPSATPAITPVPASPQAQVSASPSASVQTTITTPKQQAFESASFYFMQENLRAQGNTLRLPITEKTHAINLFFEIQPPLQPGYRAVVKTNSGKHLKVFPTLRNHREKNLTFISVKLLVAELPATSFSIQIDPTSTGKEEATVVAQSFQIVRQ